MKLTFEFSPWKRIDGISRRYASARNAAGLTQFSRRQGTLEHEQNPSATAEEWARGTPDEERKTAEHHLSLAARAEEALADHDAAAREAASPTKIRSASDLKAANLRAEPDSHFWDRNTMKRWGDSMGNYAVRQPVEIETFGRGRILAFELARKRRTREGCHDSEWFCATTFRHVHRRED